MDSSPSPSKPATAEPSNPTDKDPTPSVLLDSLVEAVYVVDREWRIIFANAAFAGHVRMSKADILGRTLWEVLPPSKHAQVKTQFSQILETGVSQTFIGDSDIQRGLTIELRVFPLFDGLAVVFRDVTRRISAERARATSEAHLRVALDGANMGDWAWDAETDLITFSDRALILYGLGPESQGMPRANLREILLHPDDAPAVQAATDRARNDLAQYDVEYRVRRGAGWRWMRAMGGPHVVNGRTIGVHGLVQDIDDRKQAHERLQAEIQEREKSKQRQELLIHELNHRVKNILAMVQAMAAHTLSTAADLQAARGALDLRLMALAEAHDVLTRESWEGAELFDIATAAVAPHERQQTGRFHIEGPQVRLEPKTAVSLALALHELATNAVKYGALSNDKGWVTIAWSARPSATGIDLALSWIEQDGPAVQPPQRKGFGTRLIGRSLASEQGVATLSYPPQGARCDISVSLPRL